MAWYAAMESGLQKRIVCFEVYVHGPRDCWGTHHSFFLLDSAPLIGPDLTIDQTTNAAEPSEHAQIRSGRPRRLHASITYIINFLHYFSAAATVPL